MKIKNNILRIKELIKLINNTNEYNILVKYINELTNYVENYPICKICGKPIIYSNTKFRINRHNELIFLTPSNWCAQFDDLTFNISVCENCVRNNFDDMPSDQRYLFMLKTKWAKFIYQIPDDIHKLIKTSKCAIILENLIRKYGEEIGKLKWDEYRNKQAISNSYEYKHNKYGWTKKQYDDFNKSRAVTKFNLIQKHGEIEGNSVWENYIAKQKETKSKDYMINKFGEEQANIINKSKGITLSNFIKKYGETEGTKKFNATLNKMPKFYSNISQVCFNKIDSILGKKFTTYYATKNTEYGVNLGDRYICLDYFIKELNICIEFNGTYFHADPKIFNATDCPNPYNKNITAQEIWEIDKQRYNRLLEKGITTYIIWENDWNDKFDVNDFIVNTLKINM